MYGSDAVGQTDNRDMGKADNSPLVSLIVPAYNVGRYISGCLESIRRQTYQNIEVITVIDGATDDSCRKAREAGRGDGRFTVLEQENRGVGAARNVGLSLSHGEFIAFVDPDDWIAPDYVETLLNAQAGHDADIVACGYDKVYAGGSNGTRVRTVSPRPAVYMGAAAARQRYMDLLYGGIIAAPWGKLYRAEIIRKNNVAFPDYHRMQDIVFNYRYYSHVSVVSVIPYAGYSYLIEYERRLCRMNGRNSQIIVAIYEEMRALLGDEWGVLDGGRLETYLLGFVIAEAERNRICRTGQEELLHSRGIRRIVLAARPGSVTKRMFRLLFLRKDARWLDMMMGLKISMKRHLQLA